MNSDNKDKSIKIPLGNGIGVTLAVVLSWTTWQSIWWAIFHGFLGWFYVIYYAIQYM